MKKSTIYFLAIGGVVLLCLSFLGWIVAGPSGPIVLSKQTTYLTEPLRPNGLVDYEKAIVEMQAAGVTPEENAAIPFLQAMWPCDLTPQEQVLICDALQMDQPSEPGLVHSCDATTLGLIAAWLNAQQEAKLGAGNFTPLTAEQAITAVNEAYSTPWTRAQLPPLADWLDREAVHFEQLHEMSDRSNFFLPPPALLNDQYDSLFTSMPPTIQSKREALRSLGARAMFHIGENHPAEAWKDIQATFALSRCYSQPGDTLEVMMATAFRDMACRELCELLNRDQCNAQLLKEIEQFLGQVPPFDEMPNAVNFSGRFGMLEVASNFSIGNFDSSLITDEKSDSFESIGKLPYDRNAMLRKINEWYDKLFAAVSIEDLEVRQAAFDRFDADLQTDIATIKDGGTLTAAVFNQTARGEWIGRAFIALLLPGIVQVAEAEERVNVELQMLRVAVALEIYKAETGAYPDSLAALTDRIDPALLNDPYSPGQFRYEVREPGYLLYSLFLDRTDDGGSATYGETIAGDWVSGQQIVIYPQGDWVLRFPLPKKTFLDPPPWEVSDDEESLDLGAEAEMPGEEQPPMEAANLPEAAN